MSSVSLGNFDGNSWQNYCEQMLRLKFSDFQPVPATQGDFGIDGFRMTQGWIFQCYCPDDNAKKTNYEACRDKISKDIKKLIDNHEKIFSLGTGKFVRWLFLTPIWDDKRLLEHANNKKQEVLLAIPDFCTPDFCIQIESREYFLREENLILSSKPYKINFDDIDIQQISIEECPSAIRDNIKRKLAKFNLPPERLEKLLSTQIAFFMKLQLEEKKLSREYPEIYQRLKSWTNTLRDDLEQQCLLNTENPIVFFKKTIDEYKNNIRSDFSDIFTEATITVLTDCVIAFWLGNCPLNFGEDK